MGCGEMTSAFSALAEKSSLPVCIGREIQLTSDTECRIDELYVSQNGDIIIVVEPSQNLVRIASVLRSWNMDTLDEIAADFTYNSEGQAANITDILVRRGYITYSDRAKISATIESNLSHSVLKFFSKSQRRRTP